MLQEYVTVHVKCARLIRLWHVYGSVNILSRKYWKNVMYGTCNLQSTILY